jgi:hypothetical protein
VRRGERVSPVRERDIVALSLFADEMKAAREQLHYKSLQSEALPKGASRELIARVAEERWKAIAP